MSNSEAGHSNKCGANYHFSAGRDHVARQKCKTQLLYNPNLLMLAEELYLSAR